MKLQKDSQFKEAHKYYRELFQIDVITNNLALISPNIRTLKYLAYRNRGLLYYDQVRATFIQNKDKIESLDLEDLEDLFDTLMLCVDDLIESLQHNEPDVLVINLLLALAGFFENDRLKRFAIDLELNKEDDSFNYEVIREDDPGYQQFLKYERDLLIRIGELQEDSKFFTGKYNLEDSHLVLPDLTPLEPLKRFVKKRREDLEHSWTKSINLDTFTWKTVCLSFLSILSKSKTKVRFKDPYNSKDFPLYKINYKINKKNEKELMIYDNTSNDEDIEIIEERKTTERKEAIKLSQNIISHQHRDSIQPNEIDDKLQKETARAESNLCEGTDLNQDLEIILSDENSQVLHDVSENCNDTQEVKGDNKRELPAEDVPQRSSKRLRAEQEQGDTSTESMTRVKRFIFNINDCLSHTGHRLDGDILDKVNTLSQGTSNHVSDFYNLLKNWDLNTTELLFQASDQKSSEIHLSELFAQNSHDRESKDLAELSDDLVKDYIIQINKNNVHFVEAKTIFLERLLKKVNGVCPLIDFLFSKELYSMIEVLLITNEPIFFSLLNDIDECNSEEASTYISLFEILCNMLLEMRDKMKKHEVPAKTFNDFKNGMILFENNIYKWRKVIELKNLTKTDKLLDFRYRWCLILLLKSDENFDVGLVTDLTSKFHDEVKGSTISIILPNYSNIPSISLSEIKSQNDRMSLIAAFEKAFHSQRSSNETCKLMEFLLMGVENDELTEDHFAMSQFVQASPLSVKLRLWKVLFGTYLTKRDLGKYCHALSFVLRLLVDEFDHGEFKNLKDSGRTSILLTSLSYAGEYIEGFVRLLDLKDWSLEGSHSELFSQLIRLIPLFIAYYLFEINHPPESGTHRETSRSFVKLRNTFVCMWCSILVCYNLSLKANVIENTCDFVSIIHEEVGNLHFCDAASNHFLMLCQFFLNKVDTNVFEADNLQLVNCLYHISISGENFSPADHHTNSKDLSKESAIEFSNFFFGLLEKRKSLISATVVKPDVKFALDAIYKALGKPNGDMPGVSRNIETLDKYLDDTYIDVGITRSALLGELTLDFKRPVSSTQEVFERGVYFYQGVMGLNNFIQRKKLAQSKVTDLEFVIEMLRYDLICATNRIESWILLGQSYGLLAEDDLTWTSDKINFPDRKLLTAATYRKSLLCYFMGMSLYLKGSGFINIDKSVMNNLFSSLPISLFRNLRAPMNGLAYLNNKETKVLTEHGLTIRSNSKISKKLENFILKLSLKLIRVAISQDPGNWINYHYYTKILHKLHYKSDSVIAKALKACSLNLDGIDSHYQLCSLLCKYFRDKKITGEEALGLLSALPKESILYDIWKETSENSKDFNTFVIDSLKKIIYMDKKKWYHRVRYRLSRVYFDLKDYGKAYQEFESIVILKSTNKNLINIWKTDHEPAGKHFVYNFQYIMFYIKLADKLADIDGLRAFTKKLRRYGSSMINLYDAWEFSCNTICELIKEVIDVPVAFTDIQVQKLVFSDFNANVEKITNTAKKEMIKDEDMIKLVLLADMVEIRRMNNGFGPTSLVDDTLNCIFLKHYLDVTSKDPNTYPMSDPQQYVTNSVGMIIGLVTGEVVDPPVKLRLARREMIASATAFIKSLENKLKVGRVSSDDYIIEIPQEIKEKHLKDPEPEAKILVNEPKTIGPQIDSVVATPSKLDEDKGNKDSEVSVDIDSAKTTEPSTPVRNQIVYDRQKIQMGQASAETVSDDETEVELQQVNSMGSNIADVDIFHTPRESLPVPTNHGSNDRSYDVIEID